MSTPTTGSSHDHGFTLRKQSTVLPWGIAAIAAVVALVPGLLLVQQQSRPASRPPPAAR